ncbi:MAG: VWA domain-containing protein [Actinobacteria bacterium]|nr:VWA domain-containing protein [Actinomycetota bacterium]
MAGSGLGKKVPANLRERAEAAREGSPRVRFAPRASRTRHFGARVVRTPGAEDVLRQLDAEGRICLDHFAADDGRFLVVLSLREIRLLREHGLSVDIGRELLTRDARAEIDAIPGPDGSPAVDVLATGFTTAYLDAAQVASRITALAAAHPSICHLSTLPHNTAGYDGSVSALAGPSPVQLLRITNTPSTQSKPGVLLVCGTHAREWINPLIAIEFASQLANNYAPGSTDPEVVAINRIVEQCDVLIVPVLNPDGLNYSIHDSAGWRKNRSHAAGATCPGIDNNRNYEVYFGGAGSSASPCDDSYHGAAAFSEAENRDVRHILEQHPNILTGVDSHSFGQAIFRPGPAGGTYISSLPVSAADHAIYTALENTARSAIAAVNGVTYSTGSTSNHAGTSDEYMFFGHRVFGFDFECALDFQPSFALAQSAVQEVTAGLRALATATIDLTTTTPAPSRVVQCIDRSGSMVAFGYVDSARANARRFIDMMSLGDSVAVVSFGDPSPDPAATPPAMRATTELPLTLIDDPGDYSAARASVDGITFNGWTPIGAGLQRSADLLAGSPSPRAVLLISDGYQNRAPIVADVLATFPAGLRVFTIALGAAADVALLQSIATSTGGQFFSSPTALDLHEIYNQIRSDMTDDGLVLNETGQDDSVLNNAGFNNVEQDGAVGGGFHVAEVEIGAERLLISLSLHTKPRSSKRRKQPLVEVFSPFGRRVRADDWGVKIVERADYALVEITRPAPGGWEIRPRAGVGAHTVAAFVKSPLALRTTLAPGKNKIELSVGAAFEDRPLALHSGFARLADVPLPPPSWLSKQRRAGIGWSDTLRPVSAGFELHAKPVAVERLPLRRAAAAAAADGEVGAGDRLAIATTGRAPRTAKLHIDGKLPGGAPFTRVVTRTLSG